MAQLLIIILFSIPLSAAAEDLTGGKPFFPWLWEEQLEPTLDKAAEPSNLAILGAQLGASLAVRPYDEKIYEHRNSGGSLLVGKPEADEIRRYTYGPVQIGIAVTQLFLDPTNGLAHSRALLLGSLSHNLLAEVIGRERPDGTNHRSYPSGHNTASFATAGSLAYAYGYKAAIPAYTGAALVGLASIKQNRHWASDVVGGAVLGTYWARASHMALDEKVVFLPAPYKDGAIVSFYAQWP